MAFSNDDGNLFEFIPCSSSNAWRLVFTPQLKFGGTLSRTQGQLFTCKEGRNDVQKFTRNELEEA